MANRSVRALVLVLMLVLVLVLMPEPKYLELLPPAKQPPLCEWGHHRHRGSK
jgi:hypothetical protein